ncbi:MAG: protein-L-isoaspartate(D-aspartate) O-methyltransferase [Alphaproteobacteria bacterium]|uniref:Protein-L-isoaspartate O-methyltransferase n=1 Tax=Candidatus Nitrobium versatile TaxID=2884831 RepID=A0A953J6N3_9BACT|nr:protein-L-isoaspartate(D-aspartate) O-methyltransferase [Candidatus Nitrobium versatile]
MDNGASDYQRMRDAMVDNQLIPRGIKDPRVLDAMRRVPRHLFMPEPVRYSAYDDIALPIGEGQTISQPYMVAIMTELLELKGEETILEIGTGSGYQAAILGELAREVYTIERLPHLAAEAVSRLAELGYDNVTVITGDGTKGLEERAPFDRILITAAAPEIPEILVRQLKENGIIVAPVGERYSQVLIKGRKSGGVLVEEFSTPCVFVPLIGEYGWRS